MALAGGASPEGIVRTASSGQGSALGTSTDASAARWGGTLGGDPPERRPHMTIHTLEPTAEQIRRYHLKAPVVHRRSPPSWAPPRTAHPWCRAAGPRATQPAGSPGTSWNMPGRCKTGRTASDQARWDPHRGQVEQAARQASSGRSAPAAPVRPSGPCRSLIRAQRHRRFASRHAAPDRGYARGYHEHFASLAAWQIPLRPAGRSARPHFYAAALSSRTC